MTLSHVNNVRCMYCLHSVMKDHCIQMLWTIPRFAVNWEEFIDFNRNFVQITQEPDSKPAKQMERFLLTSMNFESGLQDLSLASSCFQYHSKT